MTFDQTVTPSIQQDRSALIQAVNSDQQPVPHMALLIPAQPNQEMKSQ